jgi:hypothetical protein
MQSTSTSVALTDDKSFSNIVVRLCVAIAPALLALALHLYFAAPGLVSFDAASQFAQTQSGQLDNAHPIAMTLFWRALNAITPGHAGSMSMLLAQDLFFYTACAWIAWTLSARSLWQAGSCVVLLCFWPPFLVLQAHVWKDCLLSSVWLLALAALLSELQQNSTIDLKSGRWKLFFALALLAFGALLRHNALLALPPLLYWIASRFGLRWRTLKLVLAFAALPVVLLANSTLARYFAAKPSPAWAVTALFDLSAEAIATGQWHVPAHLRVQAPISDFAHAFKSYSGVPLFSAGLIVDGISGPLSDADQATLMRNWLSLPLRSPQAYFAHRWRVARIFLLPRTADVPATLWFISGPSALQAQDQVKAPKLFSYSAKLVTLSGQLWCSLGAYVALGFGLCFFTRKRLDSQARFAHMLLLSGACFFLPLLALINAAEFRYGYFMMLCVLLALVLLGKRSAVTS